MPYIVIHRDNGRAIYLLDHAPIIDEAGLHGADGAMLAHDIRPKTHRVLEADAPEVWVPCALACRDGVWTVVDAAAYNAAYNAALADAKAAAAARINAGAEARRQAVLPGGPGQAQAYARKEVEAAALMAGDGPAAAVYLTAEAAATGVDLMTLAGRVLARAAAYRAYDVAVEAARRAAVVAVEAAESPAAVAMVAPIWPAQ